MKPLRNKMVIALIFLLCSCSNMNETLQPLNQTNSATSTQDNTLITVIPDKQEKSQKAIKIKSIKGALGAIWLADGTILCKTCILNDDSQAALGIIDPFTDKIISLDAIGYFFPGKNIFNNVGEVIYSSISPSGNNLIIETRENPSEFTSNGKTKTTIYKLILISKKYGETKQIPVENLNSCNENPQYNVGNWSADEKFVIINCWMGDSESSILVDTETLVFIDLRQLLKKMDPVISTISHNGFLLAVNDYNGKLLFFENTNFPTLKLIKTLSVQYPQTIQFSKDDKRIFLDDHSEEVKLIEINLETLEMRTLIEDTMFSSKGSDNYPRFFPFSWEISPDNDFILLNNMPELWVYPID